VLGVWVGCAYGKGDFGVNRERIEAWLDILREGL
jgi:uncharacterized protein (DUF1499 family)